MSQAQLETLLAQKKYRQAIDQLKKLQRSQPNFISTTSEAELWRLRGQQELAKNEFKAAENSFRQALKLGLTVDVYYWLAKTLLGQNRLDRALDLIKTAFDSKILPKDEAICYLKLLLINGDTSTVETLISTEAKRFTAAQLHWTKGVLALKSGDPAAAQICFEKLKAPITPGDSLDGWITYTLQQQGEWDRSADRLGLTEFLKSHHRLNQPKFDGHQILVKLVLFQQAMVGDMDSAVINKSNLFAIEIFTALIIVESINEGDFYQAGDLLLDLKPSSRLTN